MAELQTLSNLFATTYNPDPNVQKSGELQIRKIGGQEGMVKLLLEMIGNDNVELATRQAGAVYLKNRVFTSYNVDPEALRRDAIPIAPSDCDALKQSILRLLAVSPSRSITFQLASSLKDMVSRDFPDRWPNLLDEVKAMLASDEIRQVAAGCVASLEIVRAFRYNQSTNTLPKLVEQLFPILVHVATNLIQTPPANASQEIPNMLHLIIKTYRTSIVFSLSKHQQSKESLVPWGNLLFHIINLQVPPEAVPEDEEERERSEWWKAKKWAYSILERLFNRFGNPSQLPSAMKKDYQAFAEHFVTSFAPEIIKTYLHQLELYISGQSWLSQKCQYQMLTFMTDCIKPKSTWALLKPHYETLVRSYVFPQLSWNATRQEQWDSDPVDYIRTAVDEYEAFDTPVSAATSFLLALASNRTKITFLSILGFINSILRSGAAPPQRFGALNMTAALGRLIMNHPDVKGNMEQFLVSHVLPEFSSPEPYLRAIAAEVLGTVESSGLQWNNEQNLVTSLTAISALLEEPEIPVRVQGALALTAMIAAHDSVKMAVSPQVGKVIQTILKLSDETDLDLLNTSMATIVEQYQTELLPVAAELTSRLCETYIRLARESVTADDSGNDLDIDALREDSPGEDKTFTAMGVAKTIGTIVSAVDSSPEILAQVQEIIIPIIVFTLENKIIDLYDNMYEIVDVLTFNLKSISVNTWQIFELSYKAFKNEAIDFLDEMLPALDNFLSYGTDVFKARPDYRHMIFDIYSTALTSDHLGDNDMVHACKLMECFLQNLRGHVDDYLEPIITTASKVIGTEKTTELRLSNFEVLINAVLYNPAATLHIMERLQTGSSRVFFDQWFEFINTDSRLPRVNDKKLTLVTICALLEMDPGAVPAPLHEVFPRIVAGALKLFKALPNAIEVRNLFQKATEEELEEEDNDEAWVLNLNEEEEDVWDEDSATLEMLANEGARLRERSQKIANGDDLSDVSEDTEIMEDLGYISPLDTIDPYITFKQALTAFQMKNGSGYQAATTSLSPEQQTWLMDVMRIAETNEAKAASGQA
ncbi:armadillo-type protein [Cristinia sonorae]|uniref:Armadillo-type protein n=1 Tax=Cristinia sonorae TaxID=1940300 RepID=A0A8K0UJ28_9AGAR|nr:armadillo-type protein [Cristinia sonorae]